MMIIRPFHRDRLSDDLARRLANACDPGSIALDVRLWIGHDETVLVVTRYDGSEPSLGETARVLAIVDRDKRAVTCMCCQRPIEPSEAHYLSRYNDRPICLACDASGSGCAASDVVYVPGSPCPTAQPDISVAPMVDVR